MQWKRPVDHRVSPPPVRGVFIVGSWYVAGGGAVGGAPALYLLYASGGAEGYIAWEYRVQTFVYASAKAEGKTWFSLPCCALKDSPAPVRRTVGLIINRTKKQTASFQSWIIEATSWYEV